MKRFVLVLLSLGVFSAHAQMDDRTAKASTHNISVSSSFNRGGFNIGAAYEYMHDQSWGFGGHIRSFPKETDANNPGNGVMVIGALLGHHFYKRAWDLSFTPSFNVIKIDSVRTTPGDTTTMGPGLTISLLWQIAEQVAVGFENSRYWVWFDDDYAGAVIDDLGVRVRVNF